MAGIDKTYVNFDEYKKIRQFWIDTYDEQCRIFGSPVWLYPFEAISGNSDEVFEKVRLNQTNEDLAAYTESKDFPVWNTSTMFDIWLIKNCNIEVVQSRMAQVHGKDWWVWHTNFDFTSPNILLEFQYLPTESIAYFYRNTDEKNTIETIDNILVYGTTDFFKHYDNILNIIFGVRTLPHYNVKYEIWGNYIEYNDGVFKLMDTGQEIDALFNFNKIGWHLPTMKHSYRLKDAKKYKKDEIMLSTETFFYDIAQFIKHDEISVKGFCMRQLPEYINNLIH